MSSALIHQAPETICLLAAGQGTRMGELAQARHKALLEYQGRTLLEHLVNRFHLDSRWVIAVGQRQAELASALRQIAPRLDVTWVPVEQTTGAGSGPGRSVLDCRGQLKDPFYIACVDTFWSEPLVMDPLRSWVAVGDLEPKQVGDYSGVEAEGSRVKCWREKGAPVSPRSRAFTGLAHIAHPDIFFRGLQSVSNLQQAGELTLSPGFIALARAGLLKCHELRTWVDLGTREKYERALNKAA